MPRKTFVAGEILTAADVNSNLMDQAVMVFNDAAARDTAIPSPIEGMVVYLKDTDGLLSYSGTAWVPAANSATLGAGSILQVVQTLKTDTFNTSSTTFTAITGASVSITPRATSSKIMILGTTFLGFATGGSNGRAPYIRISGGNISSYVGDADGSRTRAVGTTGVSNTDYLAAVANGFTSFSYLDSPNTSSSITYQLELMSSNAGAVAYVGRTGTDSDNINFGRFPTTIIAMEVAG